MLFCDAKTTSFKVVKKQCPDTLTINNSCIKIENNNENKHWIKRSEAKTYTAVHRFDNNPSEATGRYQNKKIGLKIKGLTFLRLFKGRLKGNIRKSKEISRK